MGRDDHNRKSNNHYDAQQPQAPAYETASGVNDDVEFAQEVDELYNLEITPGFGLTGAERKEDAGTK